MKASTRPLACSTVSCAVFSFVAVSAAPPRGKASFEALGDLPGGAFESLALGVSADGSGVIGYGTTEAGSQAFRWSKKQGMMSLGNLPGGTFRQSWAAKISADGNTVVGYGDPDGSGWNGHKGFLWTPAQGMVEIHGTREAMAVSADGAVVVGDGGQQAFRWTRTGEPTRLGVLPGRLSSRAIAVSADGSVVTGSSYDLPSWSNEEAYVWSQTGGMRGLGFAPEQNGSFPNAIFPDGSVIAGTSGAVAFRWSQETGMTVIPHLPGRHLTHPGGVSAKGTTIVGSTFVDRDHATAFIWDAAHRMDRSLSVGAGTRKAIARDSGSSSVHP